MMHLRAWPGAALLCLAGMAGKAAANEPTAFQTNFVTQCIASLRTSSFDWMAQRQVPAVCQCAAPRIEQRLHDLGLENGEARSASDLAKIANNISAFTFDCARPAFVTTMLQYGASACMAKAGSEPRLKELDEKKRSSACGCVAARFAGAVDLGLAVQPARRAEFEQSKAAALEQAKDACFNAIQSK